MLPQHPLGRRGERRRFKRLGEALMAACPPGADTRWPALYVKARVDGDRAVRPRRSTRWHAGAGCRAIPEAAARAAASGAQWVDTALKYATGRAQDLLAPALAAHPSLRVSTKAGTSRRPPAAAPERRCLTADQASAGHSLAPDYVHWQIRRNREQLGRERLDLVLLHNPEHAHAGERPALRRAMRDAFVDLEEAVAAGQVAGYGIATWAGLEEEEFTWRSCSPWPPKSRAGSTTTWSLSSCRSAW
ncbi:aldo/keto reductase [Streptomyces afghaniensis]|uniref:aldo/keto reductase n=1 Tax=Streptomyces afghaniensis TaxID=66865 RepID=UPI0003FF1103|nr:aldo/keto reductase [Streptomyces afghaniensis]